MQRRSRRELPSRSSAAVQALQLELSISLLPPQTKLVHSSWRHPRLVQMAMMTPALLAQVLVAQPQSSPLKAQATLLSIAADLLPQQPLVSSLLLHQESPVLSSLRHQQLDL